MLASQMEELGYHVAQASDGLAALGHLDGGAAVDLLISDFAMPGMNGLALIKEARQRRPELPALLLTGYADATVSLALEDVQTGSTALLRKPVSSTALVERVSALLASNH
jgi:CheY-like chemotaxis protein